VQSQKPLMLDMIARRYKARPSQILGLCSQSLEALNIDWLCLEAGMGAEIEAQKRAERDARRNGSGKPKARVIRRG